jgi:peptide deformylase
MRHKDIRLFGDPVLRTETEVVEEFNDDLKQFVSRLVQVMMEADGIGLAAPQIGDLRRIFVIGLPVKDENGNEKGRKIIVAINPEIVEESEETSVMEEGCLSIPEIYEEVTRPKQITLRYQDIEGNTQEITADDTLSHVVQHENDHLHGVMFVDHLPALKRTMLRGKLKRLEQEAKESA